MLDTARQIQTPEGVELNLSPAGPMVRGYAWFIDVVIRLAINILLSIVFIVILQSFGLFLIAIFIVEWMYPVFFEVKKHGQTPGKKAMNLRVLHDDGTPVTWGTSILRSLVMFTDFFPMFYGLGLVSMLLNGKFKRMGDIAAGTVVVHTERANQRQATNLVPDEKPERPPVSLDADEQKAIVVFAERVRDQTMSRNRELANILEPLHQEANKDAVVKLVSYANALMGRKVALGDDEAEMTIVPRKKRTQ